MTDLRLRLTASEDGATRALDVAEHCARSLGLVMEVEEP